MNFYDSAAFRVLLRKSNNQRVGNGIGCTNANANDGVLRTSSIEITRRRNLWPLPPFDLWFFGDCNKSLGMAGCVDRVCV